MERSIFHKKYQNNHHFLKIIKFLKKVQILRRLRTTSKHSNQSKILHTTPAKLWNVKIYVQQKKVSLFQKYKIKIVFKASSFVK
jgi:hypothetical protein